MVVGVILLENGDIQDIKIPYIKGRKNNLDNLKITHSLFSSQGASDIELLGKYKINEKENLLSFGYSCGDYLNNHELIPFKNNDNESVTEYYGNILIIKCNTSNNCSSFNSNDYEKIYTDYFCNINDLNSDNDELEMSDDECCSDQNNEGEEEEEDEEEDEDELDDEEDEEDEEEVENEELDSEENMSDNDDIEAFQKPTIAKIKTKKPKDKKTVVDCFEPDIPLTTEENCIENDIRSKYTDIFKKLLKPDKAIKLEQSIYNYSIEVCKERNLIYSANIQFLHKIYYNKCRSLYSNLDKDSYIKNNKIMNKINQNKIKIEELPYMSYQALFPEHWKQIMDEKYKRDQMLYEQKPEANSDQFKCGRCKSRKTSYYELQTRGADEAMTTLFSAWK